MDLVSLVKQGCRDQGVDAPDSLITFALDQARKLIDEGKFDVSAILTASQAQEKANEVKASAGFQQASATILANAERFSSKTRNIA